MRTRGYVRPPRKPLRMSSAAALIAAGAGLAAGSAALVWANATAVDDLRGALQVSVGGGRVAPALVPLALAALAALGAVLASRGSVRRAVGVAIVALGITLGWLGLAGLLNEPTSDVFGLSASASQMDVRIHPLGPTLATLGGIALFVAGFAIAVGKIRTRGLGTRYDRRNAPAAPATTSADAELAMWKELDDQRDPTVGPAATGAGDGSAGGAGDATGRGEPSS